MTKLFGFVAAALLAIGMTSPAQASLSMNFQDLQNQVSAQAAMTSGLNWHVGDKANYTMAGGFINGKIESYVREATATGFWMVQDMDLGFLGKQKVEVLFNKATGQIEKLLANGKDQAIPTAADMEVVEMKESKITAVGRDFDCIYAKLKDKKNNQIQEAWLNPQEVPMSGSIKAISDSQFGKITQELTSFEFGH